MVADQWKKRPRAASTVDYSQDPHGLKKKKKQGLETDGLKLRSNISLVWDDKKRCVLPKKDQVGISRRDLTPFLGSLPHHHSILADVFTLPREIFEFEDLSEVLSHKVWQDNLSEDERRFLAQLLPEGSEPDEVVRKLLGEENFHFGNPFLKWGQMICSGSFHPDNVMRSEQLFKANKKAYYMQLQNYHDNMIGNLQSWKETLESCKDSEEEMLERISRKGFSETYGSSPDGAKVNARSRKGEKLNKRNIQHSDGAKYMSYIKVSREHYQRVKNSMKHNSNSIQSRSLSNVLGDVENLHVQPFEFYEEEERQRLHDHWLNLANKDVAAGFANWIKRGSQRLQVRRSLGQEMEQKLKVKIKAEEQKSPDGISAELTDNKEVEEKKWSDGVFAEVTDNKEEKRSSAGIFAELSDTIEAEAKKGPDGGIFTELTDNKVGIFAELSGNREKVEEKKSPDGMFSQLTDNEETEERKRSDGISPELTDIKEAEEEKIDGIFPELTDNKEAEEEKRSDGIFPELTDNKEAEEEKRSDGIFAELTNNEEADVAFSMEVEVEQHEGEEQSDGLIEKQIEREIVNDVVPQQSEDGQDQEERGSASSCDKQTPDSTINIDSDDESHPVSPNQHLHHVGRSASSCDKQTTDSTINIDSDDESRPVSANRHLHHESNQLGHFKLDSNEDKMTPQEDDVSPIVSDYPERLDNVDVSVDQRDPLASTGGGWPAVSIASSYGCAAPASHQYSPAEALSLRHTRVTDEAATSLINLEAVPIEKDAGRDMLPRQPNDVSLFGSYPPQNRNEIFQPFFRGPDSLSYNHEQKQPLLDFQPSTSLMVEPGQYSGHFREQQLHAHLPLELRQKGLNDLFLPHQNFQGNLYPDGGRYAFPRHEQLNIGMQDWAVNSVHVPAPSQSHLSSGDLLGQNWFSGENHAARVGWSNLEGVGAPSQSIGSIHNSDQTLYSVLSECNELHQSGSYDISGSREPFIPSRNYGEMGVVGVAPTSSASLQPAKPFSYMMSSQDSSGALRPNGLVWPSMSNQNPGLHDSMGKPFLRSWNP